MTEAKLPGTAAVLDSPRKPLLKEEQRGLVWVDQELRSRTTPVKALILTQDQLDTEMAAQ